MTSTSQLAPGHAARLLDTNVISESRHSGTGRINAGVAEWLASIDLETCFISAMTLFELERGVLRIERRDQAQGGHLRLWLRETVLPSFEQRILAMTDDVALRCASLHIPDPQSERDAWIAATALVRRLTVVTRNTADFQSTGVTLLNPWTT